MKRASADVGFIFIAYNLRRIINILGIEKLIEAISQFCSKTVNKVIKDLMKLILDQPYLLKSNYCQKPKGTNNHLLIPIFKN